MSRAILLYTLFVKMRSLPVIVTIGFLAVLMPTILSLLAAVEGNDDAVSAVMTFFETPSIPLVIAFILQKDAFADTKRLSDGEYLSLLFTRPLTRADYVVSKWLAAAVCVAFSLYLQMIVFHICQQMGGRFDYMWTPYRAVDVLLLSFSSAAVVSVINAIPRRLGLYVFTGLSYAGLLVQAPVADWRTADQTMNDVTASFQFLGSIVNSLLSNRVNTFDLFLSTNPDWLSMVAYVSNITLYLLLATYLLNKREFFYGSE